MAEVEVLTTPIGQLSWPNLFQARKGKDGKKPKYGTDIIFQVGEKCEQLRKAAFNVAAAKYGSDKSKWPPLVSCFKDAAEKRFYIDDNGNRQERPEFKPGALVLFTNSKYRPGILERDAKTHITDESRLYGGAWVRAKVHFYVWEYRDPEKNNKVMKRGIGCGLNAIQFVRDDTPFGGHQIDLENAFSPVVDDGDVGGEVVDEGQFI